MLIGHHGSFSKIRSIALWTPLSLTGLLTAWYDPTMNVTLNGSTVSAWKDRINGLTVSQATASSQPTFQSNARNGTAGLVFSGNQTLYNSSIGLNPSGSASSTIAVSGYCSKSGSSMALFSYGSSGTGNWRTMGQVGGTNGAYCSLYANQTDSGVSWNGADVMLAADIAANSAPVVYANSSVSSGSHAGNTAVNTSNAYFYIGTDYAGEFLYGVVQHIFVTNTVLTSSQRNKLFGWESWNTGKNGSNLPANHPYKTRPPYITDP